MSPLRSTNDKQPASSDESDKVLDVVVIGAGWAGLSAAKELHRNGMEATILEGRGVMGGRCRTGIANDGVTPFEYGAQWIHGVQKKNPVYQAALASGVALARSDYESEVIYQDHPNGQPTTVVSEEKYEFMHNYLMEGKGGFMAYQEHRQEEDDHDVSLRQCAEDFLNKINATDEQRIWMWFFLDMDVAQEYSGSLEDMSMFWWDSDEEMKGGDVSVTQDIHGGYIAILKHFAQDIAHQIQYNSKVTSIEYGNDRVVVQYTQDGATKEIVARKVLVTVPLGVLKAEVINFVPELPHDKNRAINRLGMGVLNKCILVWDDQDADKLPWPADKEWIERVVAGEDPKQQQGLWTEFVNNQSINGRPVLIGFTVGRVAQEVEKHSDQEIQESVMSALRLMFASQEVPEPREVIITRWDQDEFAYGSYSYNALGCRHTDHKALAAPVDNKLFFAGEACHPQYFGTTHGAYMSGTTAAKQILQNKSSKAKAGKKTGTIKKGLLKTMFA